jgi:hypothetical protein
MSTDKEYEIKEVREHGMIRTVSGTLVNLCDPDPDTLDMEDMAWALGRIVRYNAHIRQDYTVAHHCVNMSYLVPWPFKMEALLHDAAEAYMGDIIWPVKAMFPEVSKFEDELAAQIMLKFGDEHCHSRITPAVGGRWPKRAIYNKSDVIRLADRMLLDHECDALGRPGVFIPEVDLATTQAYEEHLPYWDGPWHVYEERYKQLLAELKEKKEYLRRDVEFHDGAIKQGPPPQESTDNE